jgi:hypothetical protein
MRIASSPTLRIAAGLLLAALLSIVGYKVFRRLISHGPEALLERGDEMSWLNSWIQAEPFYHQAELGKAINIRKPSMPASARCLRTASRLHPFQAKSRFCAHTSICWRRRTWRYVFAF